MVMTKNIDGMECRTEKDSIGSKEIPEDVYYGVQSLRAAENVRITGLSMHPEVINSLAQIKKAAVKGTRKIRGAFFCDTKEGTMLLKEADVSDRRAPLLYLVLKNLEDDGYPNVDTKNNFRSTEGREL